MKIAPCRLTLNDLVNSYWRIEPASELELFEAPR
jgi:hypothetical protein